MAERVLDRFGPSLVFHLQGAARARPVFVELGLRIVLRLDPRVDDPHDGPGDDHNGRNDGDHRRLVRLRPLQGRHDGVGVLVMLQFLAFG